MDLGLPLELLPAVTPQEQFSIQIEIHGHTFCRNANDGVR